MSGSGQPLVYSIVIVHFQLLVLNVLLQSVVLRDKDTFSELVGQL